MVGYVSDKKQFETSIENEILNPSESNVAFVDIEAKPEYYFMLVDKSEQTSEEQILNKLKESATTTYKLYAISLNNENSTYVNSIEEAEEVVKKIKEDNEENLEEIKIGMQEIYTTDLYELTSAVEVASAVDTAEVKVEEIIEAQEKIKAATLDGVYFSTRPVAGTITSRYGDVEDIRDHAHGGLDIAADTGTDIMAAADGTVTFSGYSDGYGNLIIITHENGIQTYYGHCSKLYVTEGTTVKAGDVIAAVGMTGYATGPHLHFEIRVDGSTINPQRYIYN